MLVLHNKDFTTKYGAINSVIEAFVEEERNGLFELSFIMLNTDSLFNYVKEDNIVVANANDTLLNQKFRIYMTRKLMNNRVEVFARHISFDLMYDYIDSVSFENQSCEYALNQLFRSSQFSKNYKGYSDIINAQNYNISMANVLEAIGGKEGSILDTFGTGAELLRDNENIHVLNKRGHDNSVSIEYKKNLTGFELEEDTTDLITRILPYAKYTPKDEEGNSLDEVIVKASFVDSSLIANYSHPFISAIDYTDKFEEDEEVTADKLKALAELEYKDNKVDRPKQNFKIEFIPLSKCVGYETLSDNISLCDTVTILDTRYNINTQAKVIKTTFNVLKNRYESIELGEPKTTLGDIVGSNDSSKGEKGDKGDKGDKGEDGNIGDFPNSLPSTPNVTTKVYGFSNIEISWTFDDKVYYQYEVYTSKESNFTPNTFNLVHKGQTSNYMYQAKPNETWYFKVCCINTHGERTDFGSAYATTVKVDDLSNYVGEMAINEALIGTLSLDRGWVGVLKGNYIDAKQLSVTDGNGKRTLDIDSFGNVNLDVTSLKISSKNVATSESVTSQINGVNNTINGINSNISDIEDNISDVEKYLGTLVSRVNTAEQKITADAIVSTVTSSSTYKNALTGKVDTTKVISSINQTAEAIKINASKIQLEGAVSISNSSGNSVKINNADYEIRNGSTTKAFFGLRTLDDDGREIPRFALGSSGLNKSSNNYFAVTHYPTNNNPLNTNQTYADMTYRTHKYTTSDTSGDISNIRMLDDGDIHLAPVRNLIIKSSFTNGYHNSNTDETTLATFGTYSGDYTRYMETACIKREGTSKGLILANYNDSGYSAMVRVCVDNSNYKFFAPLDSSKDISLGSPSYLWQRVCAVNGTINTSDRRLKDNIEYIQETANPRAIKSNEYTLKDMYNFVKDDLYMATYTMKNDDKLKYGFIAQDIVNTKVGYNIIEQDNEGDFLGYDTMNYTSALAGALKQAINEIENLKKEIEILKK